MKRGKRYQEAAKLVDSTREYEAKEALELLEKMPDLNAASLEAAMSMVEGTARSMGVVVEQ